MNVYIALLSASSVTSQANSNSTLCQGNLAVVIQKLLIDTFPLPSVNQRQHMSQPGFCLRWLKKFLIQYAINAGSFTGLPPQT